MKTLILWGKHASHGNVWLKLSANPSQRERINRLGQGWQLAVLAEGDAP
ncbi:MAG TPA: hypothetical protein VHS96_18385 [Bacteroidia bacterium]|nr:hypothetical protein [Bacteroidia bacterium]